MEQPKFNISRINFGSSILKTSENEPQPAAHGQPPRPEETCVKTFRLSSGKMVTLKPRKSQSTHQLSLVDHVMEEKESYGTNINELYARLEVQRLKESDKSTQKTQSFIQKTSQDMLWAEKWRPRIFFDLVGNEATNRKILKWFKQWSKVVFDKDFRPISTQDAETAKTNDLLGRPDRKILLIHGPPGLGKTTVAHVIAKQVGYDVMEVNASDERSGQRVRDKVNNSLTSLSFSGKPVCLIADEVDGGAEFGFVKVLLDIIQEDYKAMKELRNATDGAKSLKANKTKHKLLLRPIIAICNDLYAPALEKLRGNAEIVSFTQASKQALMTRLKKICSDEKLKISNQDLQQIIALTNSDIRSCLNILQFGGELNDDSRRKDAQISWFVIVNDIFKRNPRLSKSQEFKDLSRILNNSTSIEKIINGCFQSYHDVKYSDDGLQKPSLISDWLYFSDRMSKTTFEGIGDLGYYCSQVALQFFNLFSDAYNRESLRVKSDYEYFEKRRDNLNLSRSIFNHVPIKLKEFIKLNQLPTEVLPILDIIITPFIKSAKKPEKTDLSKIQNVIDALGGFGLRISKGKDEGYNEIYNTFPDFGSISRFDESSKKKDVLTRSNIYPYIQKQIDLLKTKKRVFSEVNKPETLDKSDFGALRSQYDAIAANEERNKKRKVSDKVWVKYHEGFSDAVRKSVKWKNFWDF